MAVKDDSKEWARYAKELGVNLQRLRVERGLTQERVAYDAGLSRYQYQRMEWGKIGKDTPANPTLKTIMAVAQVLGVTLDELLPQPSPPSWPLAPLGRRWQESWVARLPRFSALRPFEARYAFCRLGLTPP